MMNQASEPLVSCLCITRDKVQKLNRAIQCFKAQTYSNKELIIVYEDNDPETEKFLKEIHDERIFAHKIPVRPKLTLGELRNISIDRSNGEYFCQWDDDDYYHINRIRYQMDALRLNHHPVSILTNWIIFDEFERQAYFSMFRLWEGTILCKKSEVLNKVEYPAMATQEDSRFIDFLYQESRIFPTVAPNLYIYTYHGKNAWDEKHFTFLFKTAHRFSKEVSDLIANILEEKYTVEEASKKLDQVEFLGQINYFAMKKKAKASI